MLNEHQAGADCNAAGCQCCDFRVSAALRCGSWFRSGCGFRRVCKRGKLGRQLISLVRCPLCGLLLDRNIAGSGSVFGQDATTLALVLRFFAAPLLTVQAWQRTGLNGAVFMVFQVTVFTHDQATKRLT